MIGDRFVAWLRIIVVAVAVCTSATSAEVPTKKPLSEGRGPNADAASIQGKWPSARKQSTFVCATFAGEPRTAEGIVDIGRLILQLRAVGANTYLYGFRNPGYWEQFPAFLEEARRHRINAWASFRPPTEGRPSKPYGYDWETWFFKVAELSLKHPNLVAITIDDFGYNLRGITIKETNPKSTDGFTADRVKRLRNIIRRINPNLAFIPTMYFPQLVSKKVRTDYQGLVDGVLFPYRHESSGKKELKDSAAIMAEMGAIQSLWGRDLPIYVDVYATAHSTAGSTTVEYIEEVLKYTSRTSAAGVCCYRHNEIADATDPIQVGKFNAFRKFYQQKADDDSSRGKGDITDIQREQKTEKSGK